MSNATTDHLAASRSDARLYGPTAILIHALLFTPIVGGVMAIINFRRLGLRAHARNYATMLVIFTLAFLLAESLPAPAGPLMRFYGSAYGLSVLVMLRRDQEVLFDAHKRNGGRKAPWWPVTLITLGVILATLIVITLVVLLDPSAIGD